MELSVQKQSRTGVMKSQWASKVDFVPTWLTTDIDCICAVTSAITHCLGHLNLIVSLKASAHISKIACFIHFFFTLFFF